MELWKEYENNLTVVELFENTVNNYNDSEALVFKTINEKDRSVSLTYDEMNKRVNQLANYLTEKSLKNEETIAICMNRHEQMIISIFAILKQDVIFCQLIHHFRWIELNIC